MINEIKNLQMIVEDVNAAIDAVRAIANVDGGGMPLYFAANIARQQLSILKALAQLEGQVQDRISHNRNMQYFAEDEK